MSEVLDLAVTDPEAFLRSVVAGVEREIARLDRLPASEGARLRVEYLRAMVTVWRQSTEGQDPDALVRGTVEMALAYARCNPHCLAAVNE